MFKKAYARAVMTGLVQSGLAEFPSPEKAAAVSDYIADHLEIPLFDEKTGAAVAMPVGVTAKIAEAVIDAANYFKQNGEKTASFAKLASYEDLAKVAHIHVLDLMKKAEGSTIEGGDKGNTEPTTAEGKMDEKNRPVGYAENSRGSTAVDTKPGAVGKEEEHPSSPPNSPAGTNSVVEQTHTASLHEMIRKMAEGSTILGGDKGNKEPTTAEGKMDMGQRPAGYAVLPSQGAAGAIPALVTGPAIVGRETPAPNGPANSPAGSNSVIEHSQKAAEDQAFLMVFKKTANEVMPFLEPLGLSDDEKIAHVKTMMGYNMEQKAAHITALSRSKTAAAQTAPVPAPAPSGYAHYNGKNANQKTGGELPAFLAAMNEKKEEKKEEGGEKKEEKGEEKKEEKKDEEKKDEEKNDEKKGSLLDRIRNIAAAV